MNTAQSSRPPWPGSPSQMLAKLTADAVDMSKTEVQRLEAAHAAVALAQALEKPEDPVWLPGAAQR